MKIMKWEDLKIITFNNRVKSNNVVNIYGNPLAILEEPKQLSTSAAVWLSY